MTLIAHVPTERGKLGWQDVVKTQEDYWLAIRSGMAWVWWENFPTPEEFEEYLNKEKGIE